MLPLYGGGGGGGALTLESGTGMCCGHDPLLSGQSALPSLPIYHQCVAHVPPFSFLGKKFHFQPCFGQNLSSQGANFPNFRSQDPSFFKENLLPRPYFWKPVWHTPTKKKKKKKNECHPHELYSLLLDTLSLQTQRLLAISWWKSYLALPGWVHCRATLLPSWIQQSAAVVIDLLAGLCLTLDHPWASTDAWSSLSVYWCLISCTNITSKWQRSKLVRKHL